MRKILLSMALMLASAGAFAEDIVGKWQTEAGDAQVEIFQEGNVFNGKIVWLAKGPETLDTHNTDKSLRSRKLMGVHLLSGLKKSGDKWEDGKIYNPKNGKTYRCSMWLEGKELKVRGHLGIFHETQTWKRK